jgi:LL-H family phage holin
MSKIVMDLITALMCGVVTWAIHAVIRHVVPFIETKLKESQYSWAAEIINNAVRAFEQTVTGSKRGEEKFEFVMDFVNRELSKLGIKLSEQQITVLIEAAVQAMNAEKLLVEETTSTEEFEPVFYKDDLDNGVEPADSEE